MSVAASNISETRRQLRAQMPVTRKWAYFDHAAVAPIPQPTQIAIQKWVSEAAEEGDTVWLDWAKQVKATRQLAADLISASTSEIALVPSTTSGINFVAEGFPWQSGDNVVTLDDEFPSNLYPWMHLERLGVETRRVPTDNGCVDLDEFASHCDERTRVVSVSWVGYANGCRRDLDAFSDIAKRCGALFFVDAIQGLGVFPLDVTQTNIDCLAADGHKWMLGPEGAGLAYVSEACLEKLRPLNVGWNSVVSAGNFDHIELKLKPTAERYEGGTLNMVGFIGLGASLKTLMDLGTENVAATILDNTEQVAARLQDFGGKVCSPWEEMERSGIVSIEMPDRDPNEIRKHCLEHGVALNCRAGRLRVSAHAYNDSEDLDRLTAALEKLP